MAVVDACPIDNSHFFKEADMHALTKAIDKITEIIGKCASFIIIPLVLGIAYDVFMRYVFSKPTFWAYDSTYMMYGVYIMLGAAYTHLNDGHVRMDLFTSHLDSRKKAVLECVCYLFLFFPLFFILVKYCSLHAIWSFGAGESSSASTWRPPVYPFKIVVAFGFVLFLLQGCSQFIKSLMVAIRGQVR